MKLTKLFMALLVGLLLVFMTGGFGSLAQRNRDESGKGTVGSSGIQQVYLFANQTPGKPNGDEATEIENRQAGQDKQGEEDGNDPDLPKLHGKIDPETYLRMRDEFIGLKRGFEPGRPFDPMARGRAIQEMEEQQRQLESGSNGSVFDRLFAFFGIGPTAGGAWTPLGPGEPTPLSNGQALSGGDISVTGRVTAIAVDPSNSNKVYLGTAQGGVWRSLDGGSTWATIFDSAQSLAIGALALAPSDPTKLYVGTGEFNGCADCFFGAGLYRIDTVDTTPTLVGPINPSQTIGNLTYNVFNGRGITKVVVDPTNPATIFVSTGRGIGGSGANSLSNTFPPLATRGLYRSTNAASAAGSVTFQKLVVTTDASVAGESPQTGNVDTTDIVMEPGVPNNLLVSVIGSTTTGGVFRTTNALAGTPTFTQVLSMAAGVRSNLAINKVSSVVTLYAATSETPNNTPGCTSSGTGAVHKQVDPFNTAAPWPTTQLTGGGGFCGGQCFYDIAVAVNPNNANEVYLGGNARGTCSDGMKKSTDGGTTFLRDDTGIHADSHALYYDGTGATIFMGNDGGVWKRSSSAAAATAWTNLNNASLNTLQFESIAVHPFDRHLMIGGTQDNGTEYQQTSAGNWRSAEGGDGGYCLIDQSATDTTNVTMYHTFFNQTNTQIGFDRILNTNCLPIKNIWPTRGAFGGSNDPTIVPCDGAANYIQNGISISDSVLFYAPMALGPGSPNTVYFGTDRLYRSTNRGDTMTVMSQASITNPGGNGSPISTIAISPQDDTYRIVGLQNGQVWATSTGSSALVNITGSFPPNPNGSMTNKFVGRAVIDPNNKNVAYVAFSFFAPAGQGVWKITNLGAAAGASPSAPVWTAAGSGIPSIPINALVIDPQNSNNLFAGTDIGVYNSTDGGASWTPFGTGLPRAAVFDLALQNANRILRAGTHGRGVWEVSIGGAVPSPTPTPTPGPSPSPSPTPTPTPSPGGTDQIVVSQIYGGGGTVGATYRASFVEIFNRGTNTVNLSSWVFQLASATGTFNFSVSFVSSSGIFIQPGQHFFVQVGPTGANGAPLPITPDFVVDPPPPGGPITLGTSGKIAVTKPGTPFLSGTCPLPNSNVVDFVGFGSAANCFEGSGPVASLTNTAAAFRKTNGCTDTDNNAGDFSVAAPNPRNASSPFTSCGGTIQFSSASYTVSETGPRVDVTLTRAGNTTSSASVNFATNDSAGLTNCNVINGTASPRCDYINTLGTMTFAAGETSKSFSIAIVDDSYAEGSETFTIGLNNPSGATLGAQSAATVTITDNETSNGVNPIDNTNFFVRQQYIDFLNREPDPPGFAGWVNTINNCSGDTTQCDRIHVSQLFFQSAEFQERGYFVYRFYPVAFGRKPDYAEFVPDLASVSGFLDATQLEAAKVAFIAAFMARPAFANTYNPLTNQQYVDMLLNTAGVTLSSRQAMIDGLNNATMTRAQVLRQIVESPEVSTKYNHQAYAVLEYFGYLRRQPDAFYLAWIQVLDQTNDPRGMVTGFVNSTEYRNRFGP